MTLRRPGLLLTRHLFLLAALLVSPRVRAWSSTSAPFFDDIHQEAIQKVLTALGVPENLRQVAMDQQKVVDGDQSTVGSFRHSMSGPPPVDIAYWINESNGFIVSELGAGRRLGTSTADGFQHLGAALHAMTDASSPKHRQFQTWSQDEGLLDKLSHVMGERSYPDEGSPECAQLEGAVRWGYALFVRTEEPFPPTFFNPDGTLALPTQYRDGGI